MDAVVKLSKYGKWRMCWVIAEDDTIIFVAIPYQDTNHKKGISLQKGIVESHVIYQIDKQLIKDGKVEIQYSTGIKDEERTGD